MNQSALDTEKVPGNSKNADVLKLEFEKKIKRAKADILSLKDKLRIIDRG